MKRPKANGLRLLAIRILPLLQYGNGIFVEDAGRTCVYLIYYGLGYRVRNEGLSNYLGCRTMTLSPYGNRNFFRVSLFLYISSLVYTRALYGDGSLVTSVGSRCLLKTRSLYPLRNRRAGYATTGSHRVLATIMVILRCAISDCNYELGRNSLLV